LLSDLASYGGEMVMMAIVEQKGQVCCILLDAKASRLIACFCSSLARLVVAGRRPI
jgi:hypothetical protein